MADDQITGATFRARLPEFANCRSCGIGGIPLRIPSPDGSEKLPSEMPSDGNSHIPSTGSGD
jgi:hypothetical protein